MSIIRNADALQLYTLQPHAVKHSNTLQWTHFYFIQWKHSLRVACCFDIKIYHSDWTEILRVWRKEIKCENDNDLQTLIHIKNWKIGNDDMFYRTHTLSTSSSQLFISFTHERNSKKKWVFVVKKGKEWKSRAARQEERCSGLDTYKAYVMCAVCRRMHFPRRTIHIQWTRTAQYHCARENSHKWVPLKRKSSGKVELKVIMNSFTILIQVVPKFSIAFCDCFCNI